MGVLNEVYEQNKDKSMGEKFNFLNWCDPWLLTSGINTIEPITEYNLNGSLKSL